MTHHNFLKNYSMRTLCALFIVASGAQSALAETSTPATEPAQETTVDRWRADFNKKAYEVACMLRDNENARWLAGAVFAGSLFISWIRRKPLKRDLAIAAKELSKLRSIVNHWESSKEALGALKRASEELAGASKELEVQTAGLEKKLQALELPTKAPETLEGSAK